MKDHVHLVIARHGYHVEQLTSFLKGDATRALADAGLHPFESLRGKVDRLPSPWGLGLRKIFLNTPGEIASRVRYVEENPIKAREPAQTWEFARSYVV